MNNKEIFTYLQQLNTAQEKALATTSKNKEKLTLMLAIHVKRLEVLEAFDMEGDHAEAWEKTKENLLTSVTDMIQYL